MAEEDWGDMEQQKGLLYWPYWQGKKQSGGCSIEEKNYISTWSLDDVYLSGQQIFPDSGIYHAGYITLFSPCHQSGMHLAPQNKNFFFGWFFYNILPCLSDWCLIFLPLCDAELNVHSDGGL